MLSPASDPGWLRTASLRDGRRPAISSLSGYCCSSSVDPEVCVRPRSNATARTSNEPDVDALAAAQRDRCRTKAATRSAPVASPNLVEARTRAAVDRAICPGPAERPARCCFRFGRTLRLPAVIALSRPRSFQSPYGGWQCAGAAPASWCAWCAFIEACQGGCRYFQPSQG